MGLVFKWLKAQGGAQAMAKLNQRKASMIYDLVDNSNGFYVYVFMMACCIAISATVFQCV